MKNSFGRVAACLAVGLAFVSGCDRATAPDTNTASRQPTARADQGPSPTTVLPDLTIDAARLQSSMVIAFQKFKATSCALDEGCVDCVGRRKLLKFEVFIPNRGTADLVLGNPASDPSLFVFSPCHGHYHVIGFTSYELLNSAGTTILTGRKQAFCLEDFTQVDPSSGPAVYTCANQGIKVGWADVYAAYLDCQWIDITDVEPGDYRLRITINPAPRASTKLDESDYSNNTAEVPVTIPAAKSKTKPA